jgi:hypothetical protein
MAYEGQGNSFSISQRAGSAIQMYQAVGAPVAGSQRDDTVFPAASGAAILGVSRASHPANDAVDVCTFGVVKMIAGASIGAGGNISVGSLGLVALAAASAPISAVGKALVNAVAGDVFAVLLNPGYL